VPAPKLVQQFQAIVGAEGVLYAPEDVLVFEYDGSIDKGMPAAVVFPRTTEEVSAVVKLARAAGLPIVPRGAGTGLSGGAIPLEPGVIVALTRMKRIVEVDPANRLAVVEPGVINLDITKAVTRHGLYYAPDPSSQKACSIGGNIAENSGGPHCLAYGSTTNHVLALEVVLPDGEIVWLGDRTGEAPGYDLRGVFIGSEGTLGIVTKMVLRLMTVPETIRTMLAIYDRLEGASGTVSDIIGHGIIPAAVEMMDRVTIQAVEAGLQAGYPPDAEAVLLIEVEGLSEAVAEQVGTIETICRQRGAREVRMAEAEADRERLWAGRKGALGALGTLAPNYYLVDGVVPRTQLLTVLRRVGEISRDVGFPIANVFHAGDGNLHPCVLFDERQKGHTPRVLEAGGEILKACVAAGGTLTGEHGVGLEKKAFMPLVYTDADLGAMLRLKQAFAPSGLLNPGKVFPGGPSCGEGFRPASAAKADAGMWV